MASSCIIYFDIAAVVIMAVTLLSLILRGMTRGATNRVYLTCMILVLVTAVACLAGEVYDQCIMPSLVQSGVVDPNQPPPARDAITLVYYALRSLTAPMYLVLIATVSTTTHRLNSNNFRRVCLWVPMVGTFLFVLTNPVHHLVYNYVQGVPVAGSHIWILYAAATYYALIGIAWLVRWRKLLSSLEFTTLLLLYPIVFVSLIVEHELPDLHINMFITSVSMLIVSAFVIRPENRFDTLVNAASLPAYREMCRRAFLSDRPLCLVCLEIVNLERLRDLVGKDELQNIVRNVSANLSSRLERDDVLYYLRNGSFCIMSRNLSIDHALRVAHQAHSEGKMRSMDSDERSARTMMRTCVVRIPHDVPDNDTLKAFVRRFSHLMPQTGVTTFEELSKQENFGLEMALSDIVKRSIEDHSFTVYYQPIWNLANKRFQSAEALIRLDDPTFGQISPAMFIPEAEQNGLIDEIGDILFEKICAFLGRVDYRATGLDYLEVNLSAEQCIQPNLASNLIALMHEHGVEPRRMNLEITETSSAFSQKVIDANVHTLSAAGVTFSLDDYGTGYSNAIRMLSLPFSVVKFDKSLVDGLGDPSVRTMLSSTITMLHSIGKQTLAEGVETAEQTETLAKMGIDFIQGYHYAKPMPEDEFLAFLEEHNRA